MAKDKKDEKKQGTPHSDTKNSELVDERLFEPASSNKDEKEHQPAIHTDPDKLAKAVDEAKKVAPLTDGPFGDDSRTISSPKKGKTDKEQDPKTEFFESMDQMVNTDRFNSTQSGIIKLLQGKDGSTVQDAAQALIEFVESHTELYTLAVKAKLTPDDILADPTLANVCKQALATIKSTHDLKAAAFKSLPTSKEVQASPGKSLRAKLMHLSVQLVDRGQFNDLLRRYCLRAAQNGDQSITFTLTIASLSDPSHMLDEQQQLTLGLLLNLFPDFMATTDFGGEVDEKNSAMILVFLAQLKHFAMAERLTISGDELNKLESLVQEFSVTLSWEPGLSMDDAIDLSNQAIKQGQFDQLLDGQD